MRQPGFPGTFFSSTERQKQRQIGFALTEMDRGSILEALDNPRHSSSPKG
jgi:hypothetical protein